MNADIPFMLYANCQIVKGAERSTICDLQMGKIHLIPNSMAELLTEYTGLSVNQIKLQFNYEFDDIIDEYIDLLNREQLICYSNNLQKFPTLNLNWSSPSVVTYAILDFSFILEQNINSIANQLDQLDCKYIEIRAYNPLPMERIEKLLIAFEQTTIISIGLIFTYSSQISDREWLYLVDNSKRVTSLLVHSSPYEAEFLSSRFAIPVKFSSSVIADELCCGIVSESSFTCNTDTFTEGLKFNSCLNKKIGIDRRGNIKNCPSMKTSFGNIEDTTLNEAIHKPEAKKYWGITKDQISVCKDCEFRYVCTDCRAYLEDPEDVYSKPLKCGYDPYTCEWEEWSQHPMKQKAIAYYF